MDCGKPVAHWPEWLNATNVTVRCTRCVGAGSTTINAMKERPRVSPLTEMAPRHELAEAA